LLRFLWLFRLHDVQMVDITLHIALKRHTWISFPYITVKYEFLTIVRCLIWSIKCYLNEIKSLLRKYSLLHLNINGLDQHQTVTTLAQHQPTDQLLINIWILRIKFLNHLRPIYLLITFKLLYQLGYEFELVY
jgi:hypothetical protein